jgi:hypothetical protein
VAHGLTKSGVQLAFAIHEKRKLFERCASGDFRSRRRLMINHPNRAKDKTSEVAERAVMVTTSHRGVFFGYATSTDGATIKLRAARNCIYWPTENKGFLGLASMGPVKGSRIGPAADIELRDITCVAECTTAAVQAWESAPWK